MSLALRPADASDLPRIVTLMNTAYRGTGPIAGWTSEKAYIDGDRTSEAALQHELIHKPQGFFLVAQATDRNALLGCVWLEPLDAHTWYLGSLTIDPAVQNTGLGRNLLTLAEQWAVSRGATRIQMTVVNVRDTLIAWYQRRGYRLTGDTHAFPYGDDRFGKPLRSDLAFVVLEKAVAPAPR